MSPAFLDQMSWAMAEVYGSVTDRLLANIARHFKYAQGPQDLMGSFQYQVRKLAELGQVSRESVDIIVSSLEGADGALRMSLELAIRDALKGVEPALRKAAERGLLQGAGTTPPEVSPSQMQAFRAYYAQSADKLNLVNTVMLESTEDAYRACLSDAVNRIQRTQGILNAGAGEVVTGISSWNQAMHDAVSQMVKNGLTGFVDHAGRRWSPEAYVAMDIRTTMFNTARAAVWERAEDYGSDIYQVSTHNGARPKCYPWQGKLISRIDSSRDVPDLDGTMVHVYAQSETSYGAADGLFGVNCKHYPTPFIPGFSTLRGDPQSPEENEKAYEESQQQRALERKVRDEKLKLSVMQAQGADEEDIQKQKAKVRAASTDVQEFCDETGRTRRRGREYTPVNAKFPPEDSYDPATFRTEQKDRMWEFFNGNGATTRQQLAFTSVDDYDREIERLRELRRQMFETDSYDKSQTDALLKQIQALQDQRADWVTASNLANGDVRLTNMLRSDDPVDVVGAVDEILNRPELGLPESHWNGEAQVRPIEQMPAAAGRAWWSDDPVSGAKDGSVDLRADFLHDYTTSIHEDLHQRSRDSLDAYTLDYILTTHRSVEEGTVQLLTEEICERLGYTARKTYQAQVNALREFHRIIAPKVSDYEFARSMLDRGTVSRYNYINDSIEDYRKKHPKMRQAVKDKLAQIEQIFAKGSDA